MTALTSLLGGIGLFLLGMWLMTDGLKLAAGDALRAILQRWTKSRPRALLAGILVTALVQSSTAVVVATIGFVNAGLLTLAQAIWLVFGANIGTTTVGWLVALLGAKLDMAAFALPLLGVGMLMRLASRGRVRRAGLGQAVAGFGAFFMGIGVLQGAFSDLAPRVAEMELARAGGFAVPGFVLLGLVVTLLTQASSATVVIAMTAASGGAIPLELAAAMIIGANIGTTSTALFAMIGATAPARRVGLAHVIFNLFAGAVVLALIQPLLWLAGAIAGLFPGDQVVETLAVFHTLFSVLGVALIWPLAGRLIGFLSGLFVAPGEDVARPRHLDASLLAVPDLALRGLVLEVRRMTDIAFALARDEIAHPLEAETSPRVADPRRDGVLALGRETRDFIGRLDAGALPEVVVEALPHVLRAAQHVEDIAELSEAAGYALSSDAHGPAGADWEILRRAVLTVLNPPEEAEPEAPGSAQAAEARDQAEDAYQAVKRDLLRAAASGALSLAAMEADLTRAQTLRNVADIAMKTRLRLDALADKGSGRAPQIAPPGASASRAGA